jgi:hypothetical protein
LPDPKDPIKTLILRWVTEARVSTAGFIIEPECKDADANGCVRHHLRDDAQSKAAFIKMVGIANDHTWKTRDLPGLNIAEPCFYYERDPNDKAAFFVRGVIVESYEYTRAVPISV